MGLGLGIIIIIILMDLLDTINTLLICYNGLVKQTNAMFEDKTPLGYQSITFFGTGMRDVSILKNIAIYFMIFLISIMIFLKIYWSVKYQNKKEE